MEETEDMAIMDQVAPLWVETTQTPSRSIWEMDQLGGLNPTQSYPAYRRTSYLFTIYPRGRGRYDGLKWTRRLLKSNA